MKTRITITIDRELLKKIKSLTKNVSAFIEESIKIRLEGLEEVRNKVEIMQKRLKEMEQKVNEIYKILIEVYK